MAGGKREETEPRPSGEKKEGTTSSGGCCAEGENAAAAEELLRPAPICRQQWTCATLHGIALACMDSPLRQAPSTPDPTSEPAMIAMFSPSCVLHTMPLPRFATPRPCRGRASCAHAGRHHTGQKASPLTSAACLPCRSITVPLAGVAASRHASRWCSRARTGQRPLLSGSRAQTHRPLT